MGVTIVLYKPEHPGNIGSIARAAKNFGFEDIVLVQPCEITEETRNLAKHAQDTLDNMRIVDELPEFDFTVLTHGRESFGYNMVRSPITPRQLRKRLDEVEGRSVGILFGPEGEGFPPEMLRQADIVMSIPTQREYPSMNLAMAVTIVLYELSQQEDVITDPFTPMSGKDKELLMQFVQECLDQWEFPSETRKDTMRMAWQRMISRAFLTEKEAKAMMGFLKRAQGKR